MDNNRGSAIALVLMILAVVSLIGVGLIALSRVDVKFSAALKSYDKMFNLADGATTRAFYDLRKVDREGTPDMNYLGSGVTGNVDSMQVYWGSEVGVGDYYSTVLLDGYSSEPSAGWELGKGTGYHQQFWVGQGTGKRTSGQLLIEAAVTKTKQN
jgi:hypothetical protein